MANKSNNTSQIISIPQGGGALHGIGETFAPDLHTGTGNFTVPIALPPGVGSGNPPGIWGPTDPRPSHPIVIPDPKPPTLPPADVLQPGEVLMIGKTPEGELRWIKFTGGAEVQPPQPGPPGPKK